MNADEFTTAKVGYVEPQPMPKHIPHVDEVGVTSGPTKSAVYALQAFCRDYNDDFMACRAEAKGDPEPCLAAGRRVTRCTQDFFTQLQQKCGDEWKAHYTCLENFNQKYWPCRKEEKPLNDCIFKQFEIKKVIPDAPENRPPIHEREALYFKGARWH